MKLAIALVALLTGSSLFGAAPKTAAEQTGAQSKFSPAFVSATESAASAAANNDGVWSADHEAVYLPMCAAIVHHNDNSKFEAAKLLIILAQTRTDLRTGKHPTVGQTLPEAAAFLGRTFGGEAAQPKKYKKLVTLLTLEKRIAGPGDFGKYMSTDDE